MWWAKAPDGMSVCVCVCHCARKMEGGLLERWREQAWQMLAPAEVTLHLAMEPLPTFSCHPPFGYKSNKLTGLYKMPHRWYFSCPRQWLMTPWTSYPFQTARQGGERTVTHTVLSPPCFAVWNVLFGHVCVCVTVCVLCLFSLISVG